MKKIKIGICGLGRAGWGMHLKELTKFSDLYEIAGAYDIIPSRMDAMCERFSTCKQYTSFDEMLADKNLELVAIANRSPQHIEYVIKALKAGKYVFAEKPVALNLDEIEHLKNEASQHFDKLFCRQNRRFEAAFQHVLEIIKEGNLGEIFEIKLRRHNYGRRSDWQTLKKYGGGQLNNWGPHLIDHALQFLNYDVESVWGDVKQIAASGDVNDHFKAILRSSKGLYVDVEVSGGVAINSPVYAVYGTRGSLVAMKEEEFQLKYLDLDKSKPQPIVDEVTPSLNNDISGKDNMKTNSSISSFDNGDNLVWIEEVIKCNPANNSTMLDIYSHIYETMRNNVPFPIKNEEAFEVVKITDKIYKMSIAKQ